MPMCLAQPCLEKRAQKLGQWPAGPEVGPRFGFPAREKGRGLQIITEEVEVLKTRWVRGFVQHHMARWWQTGLHFLLLHCPASWLLTCLLLPLAQATGPPHLPCMSMAQAWRVFEAFLVYLSSHSSIGSLLEDNWLQWHSHSFYFTHLFCPEHLTQLLAFNRYSIDSHWIKKEMNK